MEVSFFNQNSQNPSLSRQNKKILKTSCSDSFVRNSSSNITFTAYRMPDVLPNKELHELLKPLLRRNPQIDRQEVQKLTEQFLEEYKDSYFIKELNKLSKNIKSYVEVFNVSREIKPARIKRENLMSEKDAIEWARGSVLKDEYYMILDNKYIKDREDLRKFGPVSKAGSELSLNWAPFGKGCYMDTIGHLNRWKYNPDQYLPVRVNVQNPAYIDKDTARSWENTSESLERYDIKQFLLRNEGNIKHEKNELFNYILDYKIPLYNKVIEKNFVNKGYDSVVWDEYSPVQNVAARRIAVFDSQNVAAIDKRSS